MSREIITTIARCSIEFAEDYIYLTLPRPNTYKVAYFPFLLCYLHSTSINAQHTSRKILMRYNRE